jgi:hypothetical protein
MTDLTIHCATCRQDFIFTIDEQTYHEAHGYEQPRRCIACRERRRKLKQQAQAGTEVDGFTSTIADRAKRHAD